MGFGFGFGFGSNEPDKIRLEGIKEFKDHFLLPKNEDFTRNIDLHIYKPNEVKLVKSRMPETENINKWEQIWLTGSPFMIAIIIGEFTIAERLLDTYQCSLSISAIGSVGWKYSEADFLFEDYYEDNTIELLLYSEACTIPEDLRNQLLNTLVKEADDIYDFKLRRAAKLSSEKVRRKLAEDYKNYPELFRDYSCFYAPDIESLYGLLKVFTHELQIYWLLLNNETGWVKTLFEENPFDLSSDLKYLAGIVKTLKNMPGVHVNLFAYLLKTISQIQTRMVNADQQQRKKCMDYLSVIWKITDLLPFDENTFYQLRYSDNNAFQMSALYEMAQMKLGKKMPLMVFPQQTENIISFFGLEYIDQIAQQKDNMMYCIIDDTDHEEIGIRLMRLLPYVSRIEYPESELEDLPKLLVNIIGVYAEDLKDSFPELLAKGFIPDNCIDAAMNYASRVKKCAYMRPLLILQKFGGMESDER